MQSLDRFCRCRSQLHACARSSRFWRWWWDHGMILSSKLVLVFLFCFTWELSLTSPDHHVRWPDNSDQQQNISTKPGSNWSSLKSGTFFFMLRSCKIYEREDDRTNFCQRNSSSVLTERIKAIFQVLFTDTEICPLVCFYPHTLKFIILAFISSPSLY